MLKLTAMTDLERLAQAALQNPDGAANAEYIAAANPYTILYLIRVLRACQFEVVKLNAAIDWLAEKLACEKMSAKEWREAARKAVAREAGEECES